jgi:type I restriction enzyme, S subunit
MPSILDDAAFGRGQLPPAWSWRWLDQVMEIRGGAQPEASTFVSEPQAGYVRFVQIRDFDTDGHITYIKDADKWRKCSKTDILIARYGASLGRILRGIDGAYNVALVKAEPKGIDKSFLYYLLRSQFFQGPIIQSGARSAQAGFNKRDLSVISVPIPPVREQHAIGSILNALDDKIEINRKMSTTLEATARAFFKSWFVDFDPVRAKAEGRDPGLPQEVAALFPNSFVASELGEIPEGWRIGPLGTVAANRRLGISPRDIPGKTPYIGLEHMPRRSIALERWGYAEKLESNKSKFERGDILFGKLRPYFHKVGVAPVSGVCSTDILVARATSGEWFGFLLMQLCSDALVAHTDRCSTGTKMPRASWEHISSYGVVLPPTAVVRVFTSLISPMVDRILAAIFESRTLSTISDALLPKLMSGEVRVGEAKPLAEITA